MKITGSDPVHSPLSPASDVRSPLEQPIENQDNTETASSPARVLGQPDGPFGLAIGARRTVLLRSLGSARFMKLETLEVAPHGLFVQVAHPENLPFQPKATLVDFQLFLKESAGEGHLIKGIGRIEEIRAATQVPFSIPSGYVLRIVQISGAELALLEQFVHEQVMKAAM